MAFGGLFRLYTQGFTHPSLKNAPHPVVVSILLPSLRQPARLRMTEQDFLDALSEVDRELSQQLDGWGRIKEVASAHPLELEEFDLSVGQQSVLVLWRIISMDGEGGTAPNPEEVSDHVVLESLNSFKDQIKDIVEDEELDLDSIGEVFRSFAQVGKS